MVDATMSGNEARFINHSCEVRHAHTHTHTHTHTHNLINVWTHVPVHSLLTVCVYVPSLISSHVTFTPLSPPHLIYLYPYPPSQPCTHTCLYLYTVSPSQPNCYSKVITVDGQKKIMIFALRRSVILYIYTLDVECSNFPYHSPCTTCYSGTSLIRTPLAKQKVS